MAQVQKFLFEESFDSGPPPEMIEVAQAEVLQDQAYQKASEDAKRQSHTLASQGLQVIAAKLDEIKSIEESHLAHVGEEASALAVVALTKLYPALAEKGGMDEVKAAFTSASQTFQDQKSVTIFVHPHLLEDTKNFISEINSEVAINVQSDLSLAVGDCRLAWDQVGVERYVKWMASEVIKLLMSSAKVELVEELSKDQTDDIENNTESHRE